MAKQIFMTNDQVLVDKIREGDNNALQYLYKKYYPVVQRLILQNSGDEEDAQDIYQEAVMVLYEKIKDKDFKLSSSLKTFIYSISRNKWLYKLRQEGTGGISFDDVENFVEDLDVVDDAQNFDNEHIDYDHLLHEALQKMDDTCRKLLEHFYYHKLSLDIIAQKLGYNNANTAKAKKNKCMNRAREIGKKLLEKFEV
ncbi:MAG: sigma-70 family RNA polymerase sigma factor [Thermoflexibacter sp.]|jgi:RNA polymerase sigma factor (sigma-70 family)|nr:sigma-70 family RNA polymerase sigma factor [Thermoflexibacter sp.]